MRMHRTVSLGVFGYGHFLQTPHTAAPNTDLATKETAAPDRRCSFATGLQLKEKTAAGWTRIC